MSDIEIERAEPIDAEIREEWRRVTPEDDVFGVDAVRVSDGRWAWQVGVAVMEFIRTEPFESELAAAVTAALAAVPDVKDAAHEDRETWAVDGRPDGPSLVRAASGVLDRFEVRIREQLSERGSEK